jgi:peptide chain release factor 3
MLDAFINWAPEPKAHPTQERLVEANEEGFTGFVLNSSQYGSETP